MRIALFLLSTLSCATPAIAEGWPTDVTSYEVSGIKLGDTPDDALAVIRAKELDCNYNDLFGNDGRLMSNGYSGRILCRSKEATVPIGYGQRMVKTRIELTIAATDFDNLGDPTKDFIQRIRFEEAYEDPPNAASMHAALKEKYGDSKSIDVNRDGDAQARAAWLEKRKACDNIFNQHKRDKDSQLEVNACRIEQKRLEMDYYLTLPASVLYSYPTRSMRNATGVEIIAEWQGIAKAAVADREMRQFISERDAIEARFKIEKPEGTTF